MKPPKLSPALICLSCRHIETLRVDIARFVCRSCGSRSAQPFDLSTLPVSPAGFRYVNLSLDLAFDDKEVFSSD